MSIGQLKMHYSTILECCLHIWDLLMLSAQKLSQKFYRSVHSWQAQTKRYCVSLFRQILSLFHKIFPRNIIQKLYK